MFNKRGKIKVYGLKYLAPNHIALKHVHGLCWRINSDWSRVGYVCKCTCVCRCLCFCVHMWRPGEDIGGFCAITLHPVPLRLDLSLDLELSTVFKARLPDPKLQGSLPLLPASGLQVNMAIRGFYVGGGHLNSGLHACAASTLSTYPSSKSLHPHIHTFH